MVRVALSGGQLQTPLPISTLACPPETLLLAALLLEGELSRRDWRLLSQVQEGTPKHLLK